MCHKGHNGGRRRRMCVFVMAATSYFFPEIAYKCCKVQQTCKEEQVGADPCLLSVEIAVRITG